MLSFLFSAYTKAKLKYDTFELKKNFYLNLIFFISIMHQKPQLKYISIKPLDNKEKTKTETKK